jgi:hypothetical protein
VTFKVSQLAMSTVAAPIIAAPVIVSAITPMASTVVDRWRSIVTRWLIHDRRGRSPPTERVEIDSDARVGMGGARGERERDQAK